MSELKPIINQTERNHVQFLVTQLNRLAEDQKKRDLKKFEDQFGRDYDGNSDKDWDAIGKDHTILEAAVEFLSTEMLKDVTVNDG